MTENEGPIKENEEYKEVEQLEDVEFENEQQKNKKMKKTYKIVIGIIIAIAIIGIAVYVIFEVLGLGKPNAKIVVEEFVSSFNSKDYKTMINLVDLEGFYALATTSEGENVDETTNFEKYYIKFDERYEKSKSEDDCKDFVKSMKSVDLETVKSFFEGIELKIVETNEPVLIQNTKGLYKVVTTIEMISASESSTEKYTFYLNKTKDSCKIVGGELPESILYMMVLSEYYSTPTVTE